MELGTKVERLTFSTSCKIWQRISVCHRVQHMQLMPCASSMVSLDQLQHMRPWPSRSCIWCWLELTMLTVCRWSTGLWILTLHPPSRHGMREKHTGNALEYTIKSGSHHLPPQFKQVLCNGSYKEELNFFPEKLKEPDLGLHWTANTVLYIWFWMSLNHIPSTQVCPVCCPAWPFSIKVTVHEEADTHILLHVKHTLCPPLTRMSLPWLCMLFMLFTYRAEEDKTWHQCYIFIMLFGSSSIPWPPRYAFILWVWLY